VLRPRVARLYGDPTTPLSFATWAASFGLSGPAAAANADPDNDALPNGVEYVLGGNPSYPSVTASTHPAVAISGGNMLFTFLRADASETPEVSLAVESSIDLIHWPTVFAIGSTTAASSPGVTVVENGTSPDTITVAIPLGTDKAKFARLRVTVTN
jgi:hypothetical protein